MAKAKPQSTAERIAALALGDSIRVTVAEGVALINVESGGYFEPGVPTPQTVTVTALRRLQDGDLMFADEPAAPAP